MSQNATLTQELSHGNNDFLNQCTRVGKNSYVAKNQRKMPVSVTFWWHVTINLKKCDDLLENT